MGVSDDCSADRPSHAALAQFLQDVCREGTVSYIPNPGNAGDSLIAAATSQVLRQAGIRWKLLDHRPAPPMKDCVLLYGGGGNFVRYYDSARGFIAAHH